MSSLQHLSAIRKHFAALSYYRLTLSFHRMGCQGNSCPHRCPCQCDHSLSLLMTLLSVWCSVPKDNEMHTVHDTFLHWSYSFISRGGAMWWPTMATPLGNWLNFKYLWLYCHFHMDVVCHNTFSFIIFKEQIHADSETICLSQRTFDSYSQCQPKFRP